MSEQPRRSHKAKPAVRVHVTWPNHPRYGQAYDDLEIRGVIVGIWIMAHRAHISMTGDMLSLSNADLCAITTRSRPVDAAKVTRRACEAFAYELRMTSERPARWLIHVRNFTKKQGFAGRDAGELAPNVPPSVSVSVSESEKEDVRNVTSVNLASQKPGPRTPAELLVDDIVQFTGDHQQRSIVFFVKAVHELGEEPVRGILSTVRQADNVRSKAALFTSLARDAMKHAREKGPG